MATERVLRWVCYGGWRLQTIVLGIHDSETRGSADCALGGEGGGAKKSGFFKIDEKDETDRILPSTYKVYNMSQSSLCRVKPDCSPRGALGRCCQARMSTDGGGTYRAGNVPNCVQTK